MDWQEIIAHPSLQDLPFKIETNEWGQIVMSPATNRNGIQQWNIGVQLKRVLEKGQSIIECSIGTPKGLKVADVAWASEAFIEKYGEQTPYPRASEICVEVLSPSNRWAEIEEKINLYLAKGAKEAWVCETSGKLRFWDHEGERKKSAVAPDFPNGV